MYQEQELTDVRSQQKKRWRLLFIPMLILLALIITFFILRMEIPVEICTVLLGCTLIFGYDMAIKPLHCYEKLINGILHGRTHTLDAVYDSMEEDISLVEGVNYWALTVVCLDEKQRPYDRLFYYDVQKPRPQIAKGTPVHVVFHDRMVAEIVPC